MVNFDLSPTQVAIRTAVRSFAATHLKNARSTYEAAGAQINARWEDRFRSTKPIYEAGVKAGLLRAQVPQALGGTGGELIDAAIVVEELYAVETSASLTILGTGLGLTPLVMAGTPDLQNKFLEPFLDGDGVPLASLVFSEPAGSANYADAGGSGFMTVAAEEGDEYVISGEKVCPPTACIYWVHYVCLNTETALPASIIDAQSIASCPMVAAAGCGSR